MEKKGYTTGPCNCIIALERNYLDQGFCNKSKRFLMTCYVTLFVFLPRCKKQSVTSICVSFLFKLKHSAVSPLLPIAKVSLKSGNEAFHMFLNPKWSKEWQSVLHSIEVENL